MTCADPSQTLPTEPAMLANATRSFARHRQEDTRYGYDAAGNLASQHGEPLRYRDDTVTEFGGNRYEWDACGRLTRRIEQRPGFRPRSWQFAWDGFDRLKTIITPEGQRWRYAYDALGRRRSKRCESPQAANDPRRPQRRELRQAEYLWDGPTLAAQWKRYADGSSEAPATASTSASFIAPASVDEDVQEWHFEPGSFAPLAIVQRQGLKATKLLHVVGDLNGAPREVLGNDGELLWAAQLDTWGQLARCHVKDQDRAYASRFGVGHRPAANDPAVEIDLRFANQWEDEESGLFYNLNRYYDPETAQYASQDPLGPAGGARTHGYVHNPVTWADPLGLAGCPGSTNPVAYSVAFETKVPKTGAGTREAHKAAANRDLSKAMGDKDFANMMSSMNVKPVGGTRTPEGYRWHHAKDRPGVMQLVPQAQHTSGSAFQGVLHPGGSGGFAQWGRGW